jgi:hypothetical protein
VSTSRCTTTFGIPYLCGFRTCGRTYGTIPFGSLARPRINSTGSIMPGKELSLGQTDGTSTFGVQGEARSTFLSNRVGICVLHPIRECEERACRIERVDGSTQETTFPPSAKGRARAQIPALGRCRRREGKNRRPVSLIPQPKNCVPHRPEV